MKNFPPWILVLMAVLAVSPVLQQPENEGKEASKDGQGEAKPKATAANQRQPAEPTGETCQSEPGKTAPLPSWCHPIRVLRDFFGLEPGLAKPRTENFDDIKKLAVPEGVSAPGYLLRFLVALVPDPLESQLPLNFDLALDGIQKGFAESGHRFDRFWLPWLDEAAKKDLLYRTTPGILLFRRYGQPGELTIVLLVGESPKFGIHKRAFLEALGLVTGLQAKPGTQVPTVRILGPSFSGSMASFLTALERWPADEAKLNPPRNLRFQIATGSATASDLERFLDPRTITFCRTVVPDDVLQQRGFEFLVDEMSWNFDQAALLKESDTAYGQGFITKEEGGDRTFDLIPVQFPSHISDVRNAWERDDEARRPEKAVAVGKAQIRTGRTALDLSLEDGEGEAVDVVPNFSSLTTPSRDLELSNVMEAISRDGIHYVGVLATDLKDRLFLIDKIRQSAPDTVVFTFDNYLLLAHPDYGEVMDGVVVLSSFPLFTEGASWLPRSSLGRRERRQFTAELQQGIVQAVQHLLGAQIRSPQVWISVVGNGSLWPMARLEINDRRLCPATSDPQDVLMEKQGGLAGKTDLQILLLAGSLCLLSVLLRWIGLLKGLEDGKRVVWRPVNRPLLVLGEILLALAGAVLLIVAAIPEWAPLHPSYGWVFSRPGGLRILFLLSLAGVYVYLIYQAARAILGRMDSWRWVTWVLYLILLPIVLAWMLFQLWMPGGEIAFFQLRTRALASGLSPLVSLPLLLGAVFAWTLFELRRHWLLERQAADCSLETLCEASTAGCGQTLSELGNWLRGTLPSSKWFWALLIGVFVPPLLLLWETIQPITETKEYGRVFLVLVTGAGILATLSFCRFVFLWLGLRRILRRLDHASPELAKTFETLAGEIDWKPMRSFGVRIPPFRMLLLSARKLESLLAAGYTDTVTARELRKSLKQVFEHEGRFPGVELEHRRQLEQVFGRACQALEGLISRPGVREFLAVRVVAYLRYVFAHLRNCLMAALGTGLLLLIAVTAYAFEPKQFVSVAIWVALATAVALTLWIFLEMDRNATLSRIGGTKVGAITWDRNLVTILLLYVVVPVLGVIATQFPDVGRLLGRLTDQLLPVFGGG